MTQRVLLLLLLLTVVSFIPALSQAEIPSEEPQALESDTSDAIAPEVAPEVVPDESEAVPSATMLDSEPESQFDVELDGRKTWTIGYGFGSPVGLATSGLTPGQMTLDQTLSVDIVGKALSVLTIEAHYNDQLPETMQSLMLTLDTERLDGVIGDFTFGSAVDFTAYGMKMKGLKLEYLMGDAVLTAVVSKTEGVSETAVFIGQTAHTQAEFSPTLSSDSTAPAPYRRNLEGLAAYALASLYTEEFSSAHFEFAVSPSLRNVFNLYEIGFLYDAVVLNPELVFKAQNYKVLDLEVQEQVLLLQRDPLLIVRDQLRNLIAVYNEQILPEDGTKKVYPFTTGTDYELAFLEAVAPFGQLIVDEIAYGLTTAQMRRFYDLGHTDVRENSIRVEVSTDGETFESVDDFRLPDFQYIVHAEAGVLECAFPSSFYTPSSILRVDVDYAVSDGAFMLGLSMIPGSERVTLNSELMQRDVDYMIDYEVGMLFMLIELADTDVLQVDYELYAGGFGASSDYASYFYGLTLDLPVSDHLALHASLVQLADVAGSSEDSGSVRTMPNRHTIAGVQADFDLDDFTATVLVGYNDDRFPFDDNARTPGMNQVNAIAAGEGYTLFGHQAGVTVNDGGSWQTYGIESGLSSRRVQAIAVGDGVVYLGTDVGLTLVFLDGASPFDRTANWMRYLEDDGLPDASVTAISVAEGTAWIGTRGGLLSMPAAGGDPYEEWVLYEDGGFASLPPITALTATATDVYIGTENGVYSYDIGAATLGIIPGTVGVFVNALTLSDDILYVASSRGLRGFRDGSGMGWLVLGSAVYAVSHVEDTLYYGLDSGLVALGRDGAVSLLSDWFVTALGASDDGLWIGVAASEAYEMDLWLLANGLQRFAESATSIPGVDSYAFLDSLASEHTVTGWVTRASFHQETPGYSLSGVVESQPPTFRSIGSSHRVENMGWTLSGDVALGRQGSLAIDHEYRMIDQSTDLPEDRMSNGLTLEWSFSDGPDLTASLRQVQRNESDSLGLESTYELTAAITARETYFRDALSINASWNRYAYQSNRWEEAWTRQTLSLTFDWKLLPELRTSGRWSRPVRNMADDLSGSESLNWNWDWATSLGFTDVDVEYEADWSHVLFEETSEWTHAVQVQFDGESFVAFGWDFSPDLKLEGETDSASTNLHAEATMRSDLEDFTLRTTVRGHLTDLGRPVFNREGELSLNGKYSGFQNMDLSLTYTGSRSAAVKTGQTAPSSSDALVGRMVWAPEEGPSDELSFSLRIKESADTQQITATLDNSFTMNLTPRLEAWLKWEPDAYAEGYPITDLRLDSKAEYRGGTSDPDFSFSTTAWIMLVLEPSWNVSFASTYQVGYKASIGFYQSIALELTFAIEF